MTVGHGLEWSISFTGNLKGGVRTQGELGRLLGMIDNAARAKGVIPKQFYDASGGIPRAVADMT